MVTSSFGLRTYLPCPLCLKISHMLLRCRSRILSQRLLSCCKRLSFIQPVTVSELCSSFLQAIHPESSNCKGERRIRVVTLALPTTNNLSDVFASADQVAIATLLANKAVERSITHKLEDARDALFSKMMDILGAYKTSMTAAGAGASAQLAIPENLKLLPVLVLGLLKNVGDRGTLHELWCS